MEKSSNIGGQALLEGIMMRNRDRYSVAVRKPNGEIELKVMPYHSIWAGSAHIPLVRGVVAFIDSLIVGISSLMWSAEYAADEESDTTKQTADSDERTTAATYEATRHLQEKCHPEAGSKEGQEKTELSPSDQKKQDREWNLMMTGTVLLSVGLAVGLFILLPYFLAGLLRRGGVSEVWVSFTEAILRVVIFFTYMFLISRMKDIQRTFAYHGAEHKCINCIEHGLPLTVENVLKSSRQHKRCGTSFLLFVIMISVIAYLFLGLLGISSPGMRFLSRLILIPVIAGVSYEILRAAGSGKSRVANVLSKPGLALQKWVTREPDAEMAEVAIAAVNAVFDWKAWQEHELS